MLLQLWDRHPPSRDCRRVAQYIIKATNISFTGRRIDSIIFKDEAFSIKIKKEAINLLTKMAIIIQKYVRRYLVLLTSVHHANKEALQYRHPNSNQGSPKVRRRRLPQRSSPIVSGRKSPNHFSPVSSGRKTPTHFPSPVLSGRKSPSLSLTQHSPSRDYIQVDEAIHAQREAEAAVCRSIPQDSTSGDDNLHNRIDTCPSGSPLNNAYKSGSPTSTHNKSPQTLTHDQEVAKLLKERHEAETKVRTDKLLKKKEERLRLKAEKAKVEKQVHDTKVLDSTKGSVGASLKVMSIAVKMKDKAEKSRKMAEEATGATNKVLEEEESAGIRALRNSALHRLDSSYADEKKNLSYKEFQIMKAREKAGKEGQHYSDNNTPMDINSIDDLEADENDDTNNDDTAYTVTKDGVVKILSPDEKFRLELERNEMKEKQLLQSSALKDKPKRNKSPLKKNEHSSLPDKPVKSVHDEDKFIIVSDEKRILKKFDDSLPSHRFDDFFNSLRESTATEKSDEEVISIFNNMVANKFFNQTTLHAVESDAKMFWWVDALFSSIFHYKGNTTVVLLGLKIAAMFPYERFAVANNKMGFCKIISSVLIPHLENEEFCVQVLHYGTKFTSKKIIQNLDQAVENDGLEMIVKVLLKYGQQRDAIGNAPKVVTLCLKYVRNICIASSQHAHARLMAAGVGSCLVKLLVFYRTDQDVVAPVCRSVACLITNTANLSNFASAECIQLYVLILKTNPMNKTIAKTVGVLLIELYSTEPTWMKDVLLGCDFAKMLNSLMLAQRELTARFSLSVIECNIMMCSYFMIQVSFLKDSFLKAGAVEALLEYQKDQQNFGNNVDLVIQKCLKHLRIPAQSAAQVDT